MRRFLIITASVLLVIVVAAGAALYWRLPLADWAARSILHWQGFEDVQLTVSHIGSRQIRVKGLRAGTDVAVDGLDLDYDLPSLFAPRLTAVRISGADIDASNPNRGTIGRVVAMLTRQRPAGGTGAQNGQPGDAGALPAVVFDNLVVRYATAEIDATLTLDGRATASDAQRIGSEANFSIVLNRHTAKGHLAIERHGDGRITATLDLLESAIRVGEQAIRGPNGTLQVSWDDTSNSTAVWDLALAETPIPELENIGPVSVKLEGALADERLEASFDATAAASTAHVSVTAGLTIGDDIPNGLAITAPRAEAVVKIAFPNPLARSLLPANLPEPNGGSARLNFETTLSALPSSGFPATLQAFGALLVEQSVAARATLDAYALTFADLPNADGALAAAFEAKVDAGALDLALLGPAELSATAANGAPWQRLGVPAALAEQFAGPCKITAGPPDGTTPFGRLYLAAPVPRLEIDTALPLTGRCGPAIADTRLQARGQITPNIAIDTAKLSVADLTVTGLTAAGQSIDRAGWRGEIHWQDDALSATGRADLMVPSWTSDGVAFGPVVIDMPHSFSVENERLVVRLDGTGKATVDGGTVDAFGRLTEPATVTMHALEAPLLDLSLTPKRPAHIAVRLRSQPMEFTPASSLGFGEIIYLAPFTADVRADAAGNSLTKAELVLQNLGFDLPSLGLSLAGLQSTATINGIDGAVEADFTIDTIRSGAPGPIVAPATVQGTATFTGERLEASGAVRVDIDSAGDQLPAARWTVTHDLTAGSGTGHLVLPPIQFSPGALQPKALYDGLAALSKVSGSAGLTIAGAWQDGPATATGSVQLDGLSFATAGVRVEGVDTDMRFARLWPPRSEPNQSLAVRRITGISDLSDIALTISVLPGTPASGPVVAIANGSAQFAGGRLSFSDSRLELGRGLSLLPVQVDTISIAALAELIGVDGISGTGSMSGRLPVTIDGARIAVAAGKLSADSPGTLQVKSPGARQALAGTADQVDLLLEALEDFHYDELTVDVNKDLDGVAQITLRTEGNNPTVLDGYPFRLNINLEGNLDHLLATLGTASRLSEEAVRATVKGRR